MIAVEEVEKTASNIAASFRGTTGEKVKTFLYDKLFEARVVNL